MADHGQLEERALVERCRKNDDAAFGELVDLYKNLVYGLVYRMVSDRSRADDLAQEVFLRVYRGLKYFRGQARLSTWIYRIAVNLCTEERAALRPEVPLDLPEGWERRSIDPGGVDQAFGAIELKDRLAKALARLTPRERMLVTGHYLRDVQYEALAEALGMPLGTVKTHLFRAKAKLRTLLEEEL